jgi:TetR/AcrR family transcriptional regulator, repressor for uid operon
VRYRRLGVGRGRPNALTRIVPVTPAREPNAEAPGAGPDAMDAAIVAAAREEFARYGIRRANMEEIARRVGVSRVTIYRRFESKPHLVRAVVMLDVEAFTSRFDQAWYGDGPVEERVVDAIVLTVHQLRRHPLLGTLLRSEPTALLAALTLDGEAEFELIRGLLTSRVQDLIDAGEIPAVDAPRLAEVLLRLAYSFVLLPFGLIPGRTDAEIRAFVRDYVMPVILGRQE